ncbi:MAG TPA: amidohydrolase family protein [Gemmatimonadaceae bacterium]|nr:amidohydrolase family protein [Gemmatimonadaceae bacterium]
MIVRSLILVALAVITACARQPANPADFVLRDAIVYTVDSANPRASAVVVDSGRIVYVGSNDSAQTFVGRTTTVLSLAGRMVLPGFQDTHVHPVTGGIELGECDLNSAETVDDVRRLVGACARRDTTAAWVRGGGWALPIFPGANPSRALLDSLVPNRPAYLSAADGHSAWVNSRALALAAVTRATRDPANGRIERDASGAPSGTLREAAMDLVDDKLPPYTAADYSAGLDRGLAMAARLGITSLHEASATEPIVAAYDRADSLGRLTARSVVSLLVHTSAPLDSEVQRLSALRQRATRGLVRPVAAKIFMDGVIEAHTAALLAPYVDRPGNRGATNIAPAKFDSLVHKLDSAGFKMHVHAIGDRAIRVALDGFERQRARGGMKGRRPIVAHIQLFDPADVPRFASLGVVADFQPLWAYADSYIKDLTIPVLGAERSRWMYPIASVAKTGAIVAAGSDWSVSSMNPLEAIQVAVTRRALADSTGDAWLPEQRVDLVTMLRAYTLGGALASDDDSLTGTLTRGKAADLIVLSDDLFALPPQRIAKARVLLTMMGGRVVYQDSSLTMR